MFAYSHQNLSSIYFSRSAVPLRSAWPEVGFTKRLAVTAAGLEPDADDAKLVAAVAVASVAPLEYPDWQERSQCQGPRDLRRRVFWGSVPRGFVDGVA